MILVESQLVVELESKMALLSSSLLILQLSQPIVNQWIFHRAKVEVLQQRMDQVEEVE